MSCFVGMPLAAAQQATREAKGGHPLANRSGSLADLLEMPDWDAAGPPPQAEEHREIQPDAVPPAPAEEPPPGRVKVIPGPAPVQLQAKPNIRIDIQALIDKRNRIIDGCQLFETIEKIYREEAVLGQRLRVHQAAAVELNHAQQACTQVYALGKAGAQLQIAANQRLRNADTNLKAAAREVAAQQQVLSPLYDAISPHLQPWIETYMQIRALLKPDRRDPNRLIVLEALEAATNHRHDFYEGHVLAALALAYEGDADASQQHLAKACVGYVRYRLSCSPLGPDCCHGYLLLRKPEMVSDYVSWIKQKDNANRKTWVLCWLVGNAEMIAGKDNEAKRYFDRALSEVGVFSKKEKKNQSPPPEPLLGDAALFYATTANEKIRDLDKAEEILARAGDDSDCWQVLQARAAVHAADGDETKAKAALEACRERAPRVLDSAIESLLADAA
jgi:hypothetical protein